MPVKKEKVFAMLLVVKMYNGIHVQVSTMLLDKHRRTVFVVRWLPCVSHPNESDLYESVEVDITFS